MANSTRGNLEEVNIQGLQPGTTYAFRVVAYNDHGAGDSSETLTVKTDAELDVPGAVTNLEAKATSSFSVLITWGPPTHTSGPITGYKLYYRQVRSVMSADKFRTCQDRIIEFSIRGLSLRKQFLSFRFCSETFTYSTNI